MEYMVNNWDFLSLLFSSSATQKFLQNRYEVLGYPDAIEAGYLNCSSFIHYLEHAHAHYIHSKGVSYSIRPNLLFYGYTQLLKACLLSIDPAYPGSTSLLAHGVSARKRKKKQYDFLADEIKIQKEGLFSFMADKMFHMKHLENEKLTMLSLLSEVPELHDQLLYFNKPKTYILQQVNAGVYQTSSDLLDLYNTTAIGFESFLYGKINRKFVVKEERQSLYLCTKENLQMSHCPPFRYNIYTNGYHISSQKNSICFLFNEMMIHYLLLYNLSMIARYETDWWLDLLKTMPNEDYPLILRFMDIAQIKGPYMVGEWLKKGIT